LIYSPDGRCRAFDSKSGGTISGNGAGAVLLKLYKQAVADGDPIHAVILATAVNNDGNRKVNYTAPSVEGQAQVIRTALRMARVEPETIHYIEAHGTGTPLGDPIEIEALTKAFNSNKRGSCAVGSVKTNLGHLDAGAGIAGFIKTVLAVKNRMIPPSLHFQMPNPHIDFENSPFYVNARLSEWKTDGFPLRAGVSSFGIGGTNAHIILEQAPGTVQRKAGETGSGMDRDKPRLIVLSAASLKALDQMTHNLAGFIPRHTDLDLADMAYTLQVGRRAFRFRRMLMASAGNVKEAVDTMLGAGPHKAADGVALDDNPHVIFMFSGQGAQYIDMAKELYEKEPFFRREMDRCFDIFKTHMQYDIKPFLYPGFASPGFSNEDMENLKKRLNTTEITQPLLFIVEYSLARLLIHWGIKPHAMIGYSFGECTAACISEVFSLEDGIKMTAVRGKLMYHVPAGTMLSVPLPEAELLPLLDQDLSISVVNGPSCIVAGPAEAVNAFEAKMKSRRTLCMPLNLSHAGHSHLMDPILDRFREVMAAIPLNKPMIPFISSITGQWITVEQATSPAYWVDQVRETVRFSTGLEELARDQTAVFLEIGPGRDLCNMAARHVAHCAANPQIAAGLSEPFYKRVPTPPKIFDKEDNPTLWEVQEPFPERVSWSSKTNLTKDFANRILDTIKTQGKDISDRYFLYNRIGRLWLQGIPIDWSTFSSGEKLYRVSLPTYPFERQRYWIDLDPRRLDLNAMFSFGPAAPAAGDGDKSTGRIDLAQWLPAPLESESRDSKDPVQYLVQGNPRPDLLNIYVSPSTDMERQMAGIWERLLGFNGLGVTDNFFELGGDSLKATTLISKIHKSFDVQLRVQDIFENSTIRELCRVVSRAEHSLYADIEPAEEKEHYALSSAQKRFYIMQQMHPDSTAYNFCTVMILDGKLDKNRFEEVFRAMIERHESLRTSIKPVSGEPRQFIHRDVPFHIENYEAAPGADALSVEPTVKQFLRPHELTQPPLLRLGLIRLEKEKHVLMLDLHHIVSDGTTMDILIHEFIALYAGLPLPPLKIQYKDYCEWQHNRLRSGRMQKEETYWLDLFPGETPVLTMPTDFPRPKVQDYAGDVIEFQFDRELTRDVNRLIMETGTTLYMVLLAAFTILLGRYGGQEDIVIGSPIAGRNHVDLENMVGLLIETLLVRNYPRGETIFEDFLQEVKTNTLKAFENQSYPFRELLKKVVKQEDRSRNPLFDAMLIVQNTGMDAEAVKETFKDLKVSAYEGETHKVSKLDITLEVPQADEKIYFNCEYCTALFRRETMEGLIESFRQIVQAVTGDKRVKLKDIPISHRMAAASSGVYDSKESEFDF